MCKTCVIKYSVDQSMLIVKVSVLIQQFFITELVEAYCDNYRSLGVVGKRCSDKPSN